MVFSFPFFGEVLRGLGNFFKSSPNASPHPRIPASPRPRVPASLASPRSLQACGVKVYREGCFAFAVSAKIGEELREELSASAVKAAFDDYSHTVLALDAIDGRLERPENDRLNVAVLVREH